MVRKASKNNHLQTLLEQNHDDLQKLLQTMVVDKPLPGNSLHQAVAHLNRVYLNETSGLIAEYLGIASELLGAMARSTLLEEPAEYEFSEDEDPKSPINLAVSVMITRVELVRNFFRGPHAFDYSAFFDGSPAQRLAVVSAAMEHILGQPQGKKRFTDAVAALSQAFTLAVPHEKAIEIRSELIFFQAVQARGLKELLEKAIKRFELRALTTAELITELIAMARVVREPSGRGDELALSEEELAFYDALAENESAVQVMGNEQLVFIAHELMKMIQQNGTIDWTIKQSARPKIRVMVRRILRRYGYPMT